MLCPECEQRDMRRDDHVWICECGHETSITLRDVIAVAGLDPDDVARKAQMINELGGVEALPVDDLDRPVRRPVDQPVDDDVTLFDSPELGDAIDVDRWYALGAATIARLRPHADKLQKLSDAASNTRKWGDDYIFVGLVGEALFEKLTGAPMTFVESISDGGEDFPGVDVKTTTYYTDPFLKWPYGTPTKAKHYFLVAFDVAGGRVRAVGSATAEQLSVASVRKYGAKGQAHTMQAHELSPRLPPGYKLA